MPNHRRDYCFKNTVGYEAQVVSDEKYIMREYLVKLIPWCLLAFLCHSSVFAESGTEDLKKVEVIYIGYGGFAGHQSSAGVMYSKFIKQRDAEKLTVILDSHDATTEAKIYAICSLLNISKPLFIKNKWKVLQGRKNVSVLRGDVLRKENTIELIDNFEKFGCSLDLELER